MKIYTAIISDYDYRNYYLIGSFSTRDRAERALLNCIHKWIKPFTKKRFSTLEEYRNYCKENDDDCYPYTITECEIDKER